MFCFQIITYVLGRTSEHARSLTCNFDRDMRLFDLEYGASSGPLQFVKVSKMRAAHLRATSRIAAESGDDRDAHHRHRRRVTAKELFGRAFRIGDPVAVKFASNNEVNWIWGHVVAVHAAHCIVEDADTERWVVIKYRRLPENVLRSRVIHDAERGLGRALPRRASDAKN